jgi:hypothetical protein
MRMRFDFAFFARFHPFELWQFMVAGPVSASATLSAFDNVAGISPKISEPCCNFEPEAMNLLCEVCHLRAGREDEAETVEQRWERRILHH